MLEKTSKDVKCVYCGEPATEFAEGGPLCDHCFAQGEYKDAKDLQQLFKSVEQGNKDGE